MKEKVLELIKTRQNGWTFSEINENIENVDGNLKDVLSSLVDEGELYFTKKEKYILFKETGLKTGELIVNKKGFGFVDIISDPNDIYISKENMGDAIHGDTVACEVLENRPGKKEGRIVRVIKRNSNAFVGEFCLDDHNEGYIDLDEANMTMRIIIDDDHRNGAMPGHKVYVKMLDSKSKGVYYGEVLKILGHKEDPGVDILSIVYKYNIPDVFSPEVMAEVEKVEDEVHPDEIKRRKDLRNEMIVTIDGADAKDLDDAISVKKLENGNYKLGVHIADVSYYVKKDTALDDSAYERGTSVYLTDRVIPMLPHKLSNGICSLNGGVDRLAITCEMEIDHKGDVLNYDIFESVINSKKRMTYKDANEVIEKGNIPSGYENFVSMLNLMSELSSVILKGKVKKGQIDFDTEEAKILVDENGKPTEIKKRERGTAEHVIENFMIIANETVASYFFYQELPAVYRVHDKPDEEKMESFINFVSLLGYDLKGIGKTIYPKDVQSILDQLHDKPEFGILSMLLLRSMKKAIYDPVNIGHFGLASKCYCHFTSPIRRYPDTTIHRLLREFCFDKKNNVNNIKYWSEYLIPMSFHASTMERSSIDCEREVEDMKKAEYMMDYIGEEFDGIISSVMKFGFFVELDNTVEGLVHVNEMDDFYDFEEATLTLVGKKKGKRYRIGDNVKVRVKSASKEEKRIDFEVVEEKK